MSLKEEIASLNRGGVLEMECPICNGKIKEVELHKYNHCDFCDSDIRALPSNDKDNPHECNVGSWRSKYH